MKACVECGSQLPDAATECAFCAAAQPQTGVATPTMLGFDTADRTAEQPPNAGLAFPTNPPVTSHSEPPVGQAPRGIPGVNLPSRGNRPAPPPTPTPTAAPTRGPAPLPTSAPTRAPGHPTASTPLTPSAPPAPTRAPGVAPPTASTPLTPASAPPAPRSSSPASASVVPQSPSDLSDATVSLRTPAGGYGAPPVSHPDAPPVSHPAAPPAQPTMHVASAAEPPNAQTMHASSAPMAGAHPQGPPTAHPHAPPAAPPHDTRAGGPQAKTTMIASTKPGGAPPPPATPAWGVMPAQGTVGPPSWVGAPMAEDVPRQDFHGGAFRGVATANVNRPRDPWLHTLRVIGVCAGLLLVVAFVAPWSVDGDTMTFAFSSFSKQPWQAQVLNLLIISSGVLAVVFAAMRLPSPVRGLFFAIVAIGALGFRHYVIQIIPSGAAYNWRLSALVLGALVAIIGLLVRSQYRDAIPGRLLATVGALAVLAAMLIPGEGGMWLLLQIEAVGNANNLAMAIKLSSVLAVFALAVVSFAVWIPAPSQAGSVGIAWFWILLPLLTATGVIITDDKLSLARIGESILLPLAHVSWTALAAYGVAAIIGKGIENHAD